MQRISLLSAVALGGLVTPAVAQNTLELEQQACALLGLRECRVVTLDVAAGTGDQAFTIPFEHEGLSDLIQLQPYSLRDDLEFQVLERGADGALTPADPGPARTYRGTLVGDAGSVVAASVLDDGLHARLRLVQGDDLWVQPLVSLVPGAPFDAHLLYASDDVLDRGYHCGSDLLVNQVPPPQGGGTYAPGSSVKIAQIAFDTDYEYFQIHGGTAGATAAIELVLNTMEPQYQFEVDITYKITTILVQTTSNQPYTSTDPGTLLNQFRSNWQSNHGNINRDVAELFTGKNMDGSVIGIAWLSAVCKSLAYNVVQHLGALASRTDLSAHELGHNWGADHCTCPGWTMNPSLTTANKFHGSFTEPDIRNYRNSVGCLGSSQGTPIFEEGFESGNLNGWTKQNNRPTAKGGAARSGLYGANLKRTTWIEKTVSTVGYSQVTTVFTFRTKNFEAGPNEQVYAEWSIDGGATWNLITSHRGAQWQNEEHVLPAAAAGQPNFKLRFRTDATGTHSSTGKKKKAHVDVVRIIGD